MPEQSATESNKRTPIRVLIVEDNVGFAFGLRDALERESKEPFSIREARTLAEAMSILREGGIDVILLDLGLPDSSRFDTFSRTQGCAPDVPIIILTVLDDDAVAIQAMRAGAQDYLIKSRLDTALLVRSITYAIERSRLARELQHLSGRVLQTQDEERRRIARALHDMTGQHLAAVSMNLTALEKWAGGLPDEARALLRETTEMAVQSSADVRTMSYLLHPPLLDELGLAGAVRDYADGFADRSGIRVDLELPPALSAMSKEVEITLFRVMQECLSNIHQHSGSQTASIRFAETKSAVVLAVSDRGHGFAEPPPRPPEASGHSLGVGIAGMRERVRQLQGHLDIQTGASGTTVVTTLPLQGDGLERTVAHSDRG